MDIDVKNALNNAIGVCKSIEKGNGLPVTRHFAMDIYKFIGLISIAHSKERYDYFNKIYFNGKFPVDGEKIDHIKGIPESLKIITNNDGAKNQDPKKIISFFLILGRYYASNKHDREDVNIEAVMEQVRLMQDWVKDKEAAPPSENQMQTEQGTTETSIEKVVGNEGEVDIEQNNSVPEESLDELLEKLNSLIGLDAVKQEVQQIINLIKVQKKGEEFGAKLPPLSLHLVFFGNPGTGKTTVARLLAKIYKCLGVLSSGQLVEVDRGGLVAGYVGQTAIKTQEAIDKAMGGILFIDEAYSLTHGKGETDFGQEAVDTILKAMEDHRDDLIVIVAGYPDLMKEFIASNPGLKSRFNQFINFEDYSPDELKQIFMLQCSGQALSLGEGCEDYLKAHFSEMYANRSGDYANGRDVRNYFEKVIKARANRLASVLDTVTREEYMMITVDDLEEAANMKGSI